MLRVKCETLLNHRSVMAVAFAAVLVSGCGYTRDGQSEQSGGMETTAKIEEQGMPQMSDSIQGSNPRWQEIDTITVEGELLKKGDPIEKVQRLLPREQQIRDENVKRTEDGLILTRHYFYRNQFLDIVLQIERGKYRVIGIKLKSD